MTADTGQADRGRIAAVARAIQRHPDICPVVVSSGAVAGGYRALGGLRPPTDPDERRAAAAVGQARLISAWTEVFRDLGREVAQLLVAPECMSDRRRFVEFGRSLRLLCAAGIVPIVNENDAVQPRDGRGPGNDHLAARIAALVRAEALVLVTDVGGVFAGDPWENPDAELIPFAPGAWELWPHCASKRSAESHGGLHTKLEAAETAAASGIPTIIAGAPFGETLDAVFSGRPVGTRIAASSDPLPGLRHWISATSPRGAIVVDTGAIGALSRRHSLLPCGVADVRGRFEVGDVVAVLSQDGVEHARGIAELDDREVLRVRGRHTSDVEGLLGRRVAGVVVRTDKLVLREMAV